MHDLVLTLAVGVFSELLLFGALYKFTRLRGKQVALIVFVVMLTFFIPFTVLTWEGIDVMAIHLALYMITPYGLGIITSTWEANAASGERHGFFHWAPVTIIAFFGVIATVDAIIITLANKGMSEFWVENILPEPSSGADIQSNFPGTVDYNFQKKESLYNQFREQLKTQEARGWQVKKGWLSAPVVGEPQRFRLQVVDKSGEPVTHAEVTGRFMRPADMKDDVYFTLKEVSPGVYENSFVMEYPGNWGLHAIILKDEDRHEIRGDTRVESAS